MSKVYDLSWGKTSFLSKMLLLVLSIKEQWGKIHSPRPKDKVDGYSALSSTYYTIAGTAVSQLRAMVRPNWKLIFAPVRLLWWCFAWLPLGGWCYWRMLSLSDKALKYAGGYDGMTATRCDIRQSILRRRGRYNKAEECINCAFEKVDISSHTRSLLYLGLADIYLKRGSWRARDMVESAIDLIAKAEQDEPSQAARVYRTAANLIEKISGGRGDLTLIGKLRRRSRELAERVEAEDQLLKSGL